MPSFSRSRRRRCGCSFLEVALWDLAGKLCGQPLYKLWGAHTDKVQAYAATVHFDRTPAQRADDALKFYERGFRAIKLRMHHDRPAEDLALVAAVRQAVGDKMAIMVDANQAGKTANSPPPVWDYDRALSMAKELEQMSVYCLEEPLNRDALDDLARLRKQLTRMHLAGAEGDVGLRSLPPHSLGRRLQLPPARSDGRRPRLRDS